MQLQEIIAAVSAITGIIVWLLKINGQFATMKREIIALTKRADKSELLDDETSKAINELRIELIREIGELKTEIQASRRK